MIGIETKYIVAGLAGLALCALVAGGVATATVQVNHVIERAAKEAGEKVTAQYEAEIAKSNAKVERARADQAIAAAAASAAAANAAAREAALQTELESKNATLPGGADRGLSRDRVRLLGATPNAPN